MNPTEEVHQTENPLLARAKLPGETYALPSGGLFYTNEELDASVKKGELHVYPMAAYDEILIKTPSLLLNGDAIEKVFKRCIPQILKPMELLARDVDFLLAAIRLVTYGTSMEINYEHNCKDAKVHSYQVDISKFIKTAKKINPTTIGKNFSVNLDNGQSIELRPARYKEIVDMLQLLTLNQPGMGDMSEEALLKRAQDETKGVLKTVLSVIKSVDGIEDRDKIYEWLTILNAKWIEELTQAVQATSDWGPKFEHKDKCKDCKKPITISVPINPVAFFT